MNTIRLVTVSSLLFLANGKEYVEQYEVPLGRSIRTYTQEEKTGSILRRRPSRTVLPTVLPSLLQSVLPAGLPSLLPSALPSELPVLLNLQRTAFPAENWTDDAVSNNEEKHARYIRSIEDAGECKGLPSEHADFSCKTGERIKVCVQKCIFGYTTEHGLEIITTCRMSENKWIPHMPCRPFINCKLDVLPGGYASCMYDFFDRGDQCELACLRYEDQDVIPVKKHECDSEGKWNPALPFCIEPKKGVSLVPPPKGRRVPKVIPKEYALQLNLTFYDEMADKYAAENRSFELMPLKNTASANEKISLKIEKKNKDSFSKASKKLQNTVVGGAKKNTVTHGKSKQKNAIHSADVSKRIKVSPSENLKAVTRYKWQSKNSIKKKVAFAKTPARKKSSSD